MLVVLVVIFSVFTKLVISCQTQSFIFRDNGSLVLSDHNSQSSLVKALKFNTLETSRKHDFGSVSNTNLA